MAGLQQLGRDRGGVGVVWLTRRPGPPCTELEMDPLPERAALYRLGNQLAAGQVEGGGLDYFRYLGGWAVERLGEEGVGMLVTVRGPAGRRETLQVDRPALNYTELRGTALFSAEGGPHAGSGGLQAGPLPHQPAPPPHLLRH